MRVCCPQCEKHLNAPDSEAGRKVRCPECQAVMRLPGPAPQLRQAREVRYAHERFDDQFSEENPSARPAKNQKRCPGCTQFVPRSSSRCPFCDRRLRGSGKSRKTNARRRKQLAEGDITLGEGLLCVVMSGIALIIGLVYLSSGDPKAGKMLAFSAIAIAIKFVIVGGLILAGGVQ